MKAINSVLIICMVSLNVSAAFTEPVARNKRKSNKENRKHQAYIAEHYKKTIANLPEQKEKIIRLKNSWEITINEKCNLLIFESINTDAEIVMRNICLSD